MPHVRLSLVVIAVVLAAGALAAVGSGQRAASGSARLVDIGGRKISLECRGKGSPTVILESGYRDRADPGF